MAATGNSPALPATLPFTPGQGPHPVGSVLYSKSDVSDTSPVWVDVSSKVRSFSTGRGRSSELTDVDTGTAEVRLDNRERTFDPIIDSGIGPGNQWWIREQFSGETQDIFKGYAESYDQAWSPGGKTDAITTVRCVDEFKLLALDKLPTMSPPRDTYADLVRFDEPQGYWQFIPRDWSVSGGGVLLPDIGPDWAWENGDRRIVGGRRPDCW